MAADGIDTGQRLRKRTRFSNPTKSSILKPVWSKERDGKIGTILAEDLDSCGLFGRTFLEEASVLLELKSTRALGVERSELRSVASGECKVINNSCTSHVAFLVLSLRAPQGTWANGSISNRPVIVDSRSYSIEGDHLTAQVLIPVYTILIQQANHLISTISTVLLDRDPSPHFWDASVLPSSQYSEPMVQLQHKDLPQKLFNDLFFVRAFIRILILSVQTRSSGRILVIWHSGSAGRLFKNLRTYGPPEPRSRHENFLPKGAVYWH